MRKINPRDLWLAAWVEIWRNGKYFRFYVGDICVLEPRSKSKPANKIRGRKCEIIWIAQDINKTAIKYLDTGKEGRACPYDLVLIKRKPVDFTAYRETRRHLLIDQGGE